MVLAHKDALSLLRNESHLLMTEAQEARQQFQEAQVAWDLELKNLRQVNADQLESKHGVLEVEKISLTTQLHATLVELSRVSGELSILATTNSSIEARNFDLERENKRFVEAEAVAAVQRNEMTQKAAESNAAELKGCRDICQTSITLIPSNNGRLSRTTR